MALRRSKLYGLLATAVVAASLLGCCSVPWLGTVALQKRGQLAHLEVEAEGGALSLAGLRYKRVTFIDKEKGTLDGSFSDVTVAWSALWGRVQLDGARGELTLEGSLENLRERFRAKSTATSPSTAERPNSPTVRLHNLRLNWRPAKESRTQCTAEGVAVSFDQSSATLDVPKLRCSDERGHIQASSTRLTLPRHLGQQPSVELPSTAAPLELETQEAQIQLGSLASPATSLATSTSTKAEPPGVQSASSAPSKPRLAPPAGPSATEPRTKTSPSVVEPAASSTDSESNVVTVLRSALIAQHPLIQAAWEQLPKGATAKLHRLSVRFQAAEQKLDLGPLDVTAHLEPESLLLEVTQIQSTGAPALKVRWRLYRQSRRSEIVANVGPTTLSRLGISDDDFGLKQVEQASVQLDARVEVLDGSPEIQVSSSGRVSNLSLRQPWIAKETLSGIGLEWEGSLKINAAHKHVQLSPTRLRIGSVTAHVDGQFDYDEQAKKLDGKFEIHQASCQSFIDSIPQGLAPLLENWQVAGTLGLSLAIAYDAKRIADTQVKLRLDNRCTVAGVPPAVSPHRFEEPFTLDVEDSDGNYQSQAFGPGTWAWTPLSDITPHLQSAVLVCEDGRFPYHAGIDVEAIANSIRENLRTARFARGGSTISMQLAKNLYLRRDKTLSRKAQEAAFTVLLEQTFPKAKLLELYFNVIEFGRGIYGIGPAAKHYFDTTPDRLSLAQAFFLGCILPNPKATYFKSDGSLTVGRTQLQGSLMSIAKKRGYISQEELDAGLAESLKFRSPSAGASESARSLPAKHGDAAPDDDLVPPPFEPRGDN